MASRLTPGGPTTATTTGGASMGDRSTNGTWSFFSPRSKLRRADRSALPALANVKAYSSVKVRSIV